MPADARSSRALLLAVAATAGFSIVALSALLFLMRPTPAPTEPTFELSCRAQEFNEGRQTPFGDFCGPGDKMFFGVQASSEHRYLSAFSLSSVGAAHWFMPSDDSLMSIDTQPERGFQWIAATDDVSSLPGEGEHQVVALFSKQPLDQAEVRDVWLALTGNASSAPVHGSFRGELRVGDVIVIQRKLLRVDG